MIYDLKELNERLRNTEWRNDSEKAESIAWMLFGIAERLEALVEAQKPRLQGEPDRNENETPQPVATLCEVVDGLLRDDHFWEWYKEDSVRLYHALTAERKRAVLVKNALNAARKYVEQYRDTSFAKYVIEAVDALDAFDKGAENG